MSYVINYNNVIIISSSIILLMISSLHMIISADVEDSFLGSICLNNTKEFTTNYSQGLTYAVDAVCGNAPKNGGFFQTMQYEDPSNRVFALGLCRGDISSADCTKCLTTATIKVANYDCLNKTGAVIWRDHCLLKYADVDFRGTPDTQYRFRGWTGVGTVTFEFRKSVKSITDEVKGAAVKNKDLFAYVKGNGTQVLYAMAQCTRDLDSDECNNCLQNAYDNFIVAQDGARSFYGSCTLRYATSPFSNLKA